jgi:hypothetical protein
MYSSASKNIQRLKKSQRVQRVNPINHASPGVRIHGRKAGQKIRMNRYSPTQGSDGMEQARCSTIVRAPGMISTLWLPLPMNPGSAFFAGSIDRSDS